VTEFGIVKDPVKPMQSLNALAGIEVSASEIVRDPVKPEQP
jgi:hypothetical protein